jgi:ATP-dependent Clp protease ATP-binding subunit ClpA
MTSNLGASEANVMGFTKDEKLNEDKAIKKFFAPEFRNRLDATVNFGALSLEVVAQVVSKFINDLEAQISNKNIKISLSIKAKKELARLGYDKLMGARPLNRVIAQHIKQPLTDEILFGQLKNGGSVHIDFVHNAFQFEYTKL